MVVISLQYHQGSLGPLASCEAYHLHVNEGMSLEAIRDEVKNLRGERPSKKGVFVAIKRVQVMKQQGDVAPRTKYVNCGRKEVLTEEQKASMFNFVKRWRHKRFCTCAYIKRAMKLMVTKRTICNVLHKKGFCWRPVPNKTRLNLRTTLVIT